MTDTVTVDHVVAGSTPVRHPKTSSNYRAGLQKITLEAGFVRLKYEPGFVPGGKIRPPPENLPR